MELVLKVHIQSLLVLMRWTLVLKVELTCFGFQFASFIVSCHTCWCSIYFLLVVLEFLQLLSEATIFFKQKKQKKKMNILGWRYAYKRQKILKVAFSYDLQVIGLTETHVVWRRRYKNHNSDSSSTRQTHEVFFSGIEDQNIFSGIVSTLSHCFKCIYNRENINRKFPKHEGLSIDVFKCTHFQ